MTSFARTGNRPLQKKMPEEKAVTWIGEPHARALIFPPNKWDRTAVVEELKACGIEAVIVEDDDVEISLHDVHIVVVVYGYTGDRNYGIGHPARNAGIPVVFPQPGSAVATIRRELRC